MNKRQWIAIAIVGVLALIAIGWSAHGYGARYCIDLKAANILKDVKDRTPIDCAEFWLNRYQTTFQTTASLAVGVVGLVLVLQQLSKLTDQNKIQSDALRLSAHMAAGPISDQLAGRLSEVKAQMKLAETLKAARIVTPQNIEEFLKRDEQISAILDLLSERLDYLKPSLDEIAQIGADYDPNSHAWGRIEGGYRWIKSMIDGLQQIQGKEGLDHIKRERWSAIGGRIRDVDKEIAEIENHLRTEEADLKPRIMEMRTFAAGIRFERTQA